MQLGSVPNLKKVLFEGLPKRFARKEALGIGQQSGLAIRTIDKYLKGFLESGFLKQPEYGIYEKS